jgi:hypothetical protein
LKLFHLGYHSLHEDRLPVINVKEQKLSGKRMEMDEKEVKEENRKIRYLRILVDFSILSIQQDDLLLQEALQLAEDVKKAASGLFPGKEETFELIYRPRFNRVIQERFGFS